MFEYIQIIGVLCFAIWVVCSCLYGLICFIMQKTNLKHDIITPKGVRHE